MHGGYEQFTAEDFSFGLVWIQILSLFGKIPCAIFAIITGFYMIDKGRERHYRKIIAIIFEMLLYSWLILGGIFCGVVWNCPSRL